MTPQRWLRSIPESRPRDGRRTPAARARHIRRPALEPMELRQLLSTLTEFPVPTPGTLPESIVAGPDGNLWFTEGGVRVGMINPTTHTTTDFTTPTAASYPYGITAGPDGNLWFTEAQTGAVAMINPTTHAITEFPTPTPNSAPHQIVSGPDGNLWFTEINASKIGAINPTTHVITEFTIPTAGADPEGIAAGPDGNLWFTEEAGNKIGMISPTTHAISEFAIPTASSQPYEIAAGPDGNIWFTEFASYKIGSISAATHAIQETSLPAGNFFPYGIAAGPDGDLWFTELSNSIGSINPVTRSISETTVTTPNSYPHGIAAGPDGNIWFVETVAGKVGVVVPTLGLGVVAGPPTHVTPNSPFGLTVDVEYPSGLVDTGYNGNVTLALVNPNANGAALAGTLTVAAKNGVATFTGLSINQAGPGYRILAYTDPTTTTLSTPVTVAAPPTIVAEKLIYAGKGRRKHVVAIELDFSSAMDPTRAANLAEYTLTQSTRHGRQLVAQAVGVRAAYDATAHSVTLTLAGKPKFARGGKLSVSGTPPGGLTDASGVPLDGGGTGAIGDDGTFIITPKGRGISR